ncbi:glycosyltransferase family 2 protein [Microbacterium schleiferi]|uniref:glycosyltransferase family 2 protein n=1 Tax=Microbacterium schleiferi TaxID=69362 RepID=UPI0035C7BDDC|tara:strand:+ start:1942 stop:2829 length:888 start_codon:yes stop_codon:yes gene_type:complete
MEPSFGLVVTTLGRLEALRALLTSLEGQLALDDHIVLVAQGNQDAVAALAAEFAATGLPVTATTSGRGASRGRNTGVAALPPGERILTFPNDNTLYPAGTIARLREAVSGESFVVGGFTSWDERGPKTALPDPGTQLDIFNVWSVIEMGILIKRALFDEAGGFDERIGPGAETPWQVAEGTDLLLRVMRARPEVVDSFVWVDRAVHVDGISTAFGLTDIERRRKLRAYGRGTGRAVSVHSYPLWWRAAFVGAGLLYGLRNPKPVRVSDGWPMFVGRLEGMLGRTFGRRTLVSTTR